LTGASAITPFVTFVSETDRTAAEDGSVDATEDVSGTTGVGLGPTIFTGEDALGGGMGAFVVNAVAEIGISEGVI